MAAARAVPPETRVLPQLSTQAAPLPGYSTRARDSAAHPSPAYGSQPRNWERVRASSPPSGHSPLQTTHDSSPWARPGPRPPDTTPGPHPELPALHLRAAPVCVVHCTATPLLERPPTLAPHSSTGPGVTSVTLGSGSSPGPHARCPHTGISTRSGASKGHLRHTAWAMCEPRGHGGAAAATLSPGLWPLICGPRTQAEQRYTIETQTFPSQDAPPNRPSLARKFSSNSPPENSGERFPLRRAEFLFEIGTLKETIWLYKTNGLTFPVVL